MKDNFVKVGPKQRHLDILKGYSLVKDGVLENGDMAANLYDVKWEHIEDEYIELPVDIFDFVIRQNKNREQY